VSGSLVPTPLRGTRNQEPVEPGIDEVSGSRGSEGHESVIIATYYFAALVFVRLVPPESLAKIGLIA
jgi:hypothetical protein